MYRGAIEAGDFIFRMNRLHSVWQLPGKTGRCF